MRRAAVARRAAAAPEPRAYTPRHLIERILTSRAALQGERKPVTVLFADVQGSMALAEQVDPEEWHAIMNQFFAILSDGVHRFEGTVNQYTGDGIMALFGAPLAHEDHAQRACYAALHLTGALREYAQPLRRERGLQFSVRMGLNSGEVVVGAHRRRPAHGLHRAGPHRRPRLAHGAALRAGTRLPHRAHRRAGGRLLRARGSRPVHHQGRARAAARLRAARRRGRCAPASTWRARAACRASSAARDELALLDAALCRGGRRRAVAGRRSSSPRPGSGKSRLCAEFAERCRARGAAVVETQALAHGAALPYLPVLTLFRRLFGVDERDAPETARQKIAGGLLLLDDAFKTRLPLLFDFLGVPDPTRGALAADPETRMRAAGRHLRRAAARARRRASRRCC